MALIFGNPEIAAFKDWAREHAIQIDPLDGFNGDPEKLSILDRAIEGKKIALIGEQDHFVHQKYDYRTLVARYLFSHGWRWFGEEMGFSDGLLVDRFLKTGDQRHLDNVSIYGNRNELRIDRNDDPTGILKDGWSSEEFPQREFNAEQFRFARALAQLQYSSPPGRDSIRFFGFDCDALVGRGYRDLEEILAPFEGDELVRKLRGVLARVPGETRAEEISRLRSSRDLIVAEKPHLEGLVGAENFALLEQSAFCLAESFAYTEVAYPATTWKELNRGFAIREQVMHRNMELIISRADKTQAGKPVPQKFALMSHNEHLAKDIFSIKRKGGAGPGGGRVESIGTCLERTMPGQVFSIWMLCGRGRDSQPLSYMSNEVQSPNGTLNEMLSDIGAAFVLPINEADSLPTLLQREIKFVSNGNVVHRTVITRQTDAIFFVREVTPLRDVAYDL